MNAPASGENVEVALTSSDPEPPVGTVVRDVDGRCWVRGSVEDRRCWQPLDEDGELDDDDSESWTRVAGNYGPVTVQNGSSEDHQ